MVDTTLIASGTFVSGRVTGDGHLAVDGRLQGSVDLSESLTIGPSGLVNGDVRAREVVIDGSFQGEITAVERVVLNATARAVAKITAPVVLMADGAQLRGELAIGDVSADASAPVSTATRATANSRSATTRSTPTQRTSAPSTPIRSATPVAAAASAARPGLAATTAPTTTTVVVETEPEPEPEPHEQSVPLGEASQETFEIAEEELDELREDYTVKELRDELRRRDLPVSGTKDELIERFLQAQAEEAQS